MKIGILTFHRAHNYGAVLQCYALQEFLKNRGHDVQVIDYRQSWIESFYSPFHWLYIKKNLSHPKAVVKHLWKIVPRIKRLRQSRRVFESFRKKYLILSCRYDTGVFSQRYDAIVIGSDQLWSTACLGGRFDPVYMGNFYSPNKPHVIGYAISSNKKSLNSLDSVLLDKQLKNFFKISFREPELVDILEKKCEKKFQLCVDPTLLTEQSFWKEMVKKEWQKRKYIVIYQARPYERNPSILFQKAMEYKEIVDENLEIIDLSGMVFDVDDFVSAIKFAECVITTSFHATVFSLIMGTSFFSIKLNDGHDGRYVDLLNAVCANEFCVDVDFVPQKKKYDFKLIHERMQLLAKGSKEFLDCL